MLYVEDDKNCPFEDEWRASKGITAKDKAKIDAKFANIESIDDELPTKWWSRYKSSNGLWELRVTGQGHKMLRPLGIRQGPRELLFFFGSVEKGNSLDSGDLKRAESLKADYENGKGKKKRWKK